MTGNGFEPINLSITVRGSNAPFKWLRTRLTWSYLFN